MVSRVLRVLDGLRVCGVAELGRRGEFGIAERRYCAASAMSHRQSASALQESEPTSNFAANLFRYTSELLQCRFQVFDDLGGNLCWRRQIGAVLQAVVFQPEDV